jgi:hypothetical protein
MYTLYQYILNFTKNGIMPKFLYCLHVRIVISFDFISGRRRMGYKIPLWHKGESTIKQPVYVSK